MQKTIDKPIGKNWRLFTILYFTIKNIWLISKVHLLTSKLNWDKFIY